MKKLNVIGAGRVGKTLANLFVANQALTIGDVFDTDESRAKQAVEFIGGGSAVVDIAQIRPADIWLISVPDTHIASVAVQLSDQCAGVQDSIAVHSSGALSAEALAPLRAKRCAIASAHPVLSFADPGSAIFQFEGTPCGLEGDERARAVWGEALSGVGARCFNIRSEKKKLYHAAAVFASNFLPVLSAISLELWNEAGIPQELGETMLRTLARNSVGNLVALGPRDALTGPASRGDTTVVCEQARALAKWDTKTSEAYQVLSELAVRLATTGSAGAGEINQ